MKILFVNPSLRPDAPHRLLPVGLGYVITYVREAGIDYDLLDIDIGNYSDEYVEKYLKTHKYDVVCIGSIVTHYKWMKWFIKTAKEANNDTKIIVGNSVGSSIPEILFTITPVDVAIIGEAEESIVEVLTKLSKGLSLGEAEFPITEIPHNNGDFKPCVKGQGVPGIIFRDKKGNFVNNGRRKAVRKIDDFPFPDWDIFDVEAYQKKTVFASTNTWLYPPEEAVLFPINTARGCVFKCTFCHYVFWNDPYRHRSPENVIAEIKRNQKKWNCNALGFWDELSFHSIGPTEKFLDALIEADLGVHYTCAIRSDLMGKDKDKLGKEIPYDRRLRLAEKFVESGCLSVSYSLESGNDEILKSMNKKVESKFFDEQVKICRKVGLTTNTSLVIGYPQETKETIAESMQKLMDLNVYPSPGFLLPLPETGMWDHAIDNNFITDTEQFLNDMTERQDIILNMTEMSDKELMDEVTKWLDILNQKFGNLKKENLIKTGGYRKHQKHQDKQLNSRAKKISDNKLLKIVDSDGFDSNETTNDSLNYASQSGTVT